MHSMPNRCATYRLLTTTASWNIFHVDIATHKLHIIHREIEYYVCECESVSARRYTIYRNAQRQHTHSATIMLGYPFLSLMPLWPNLQRFSSFCLHHHLSFYPFSCHFVRSTLTQPTYITYLVHFSIM